MRPEPPLTAPIVTLWVTLSGPIRTREFQSPSCPPPRNQKPPNYLIRVRLRRKCPIPHLSICHTEVQQTYSRLQGDLQNLASKIGELEQEAEEHVYVCNSLCLYMSPNANSIQFGSIDAERGTG